MFVFMEACQPVEELRRHILLSNAALTGNHQSNLGPRSPEATGRCSGIGVVRHCGHGVIQVESAEEYGPSGMLGGLAIRPRARVALPDTPLVIHLVFLMYTSLSCSSKEGWRSNFLEVPNA